MLRGSIKCYISERRTRKSTAILIDFINFKVSNWSPVTGKNIKKLREDKIYISTISNNFSNYISLVFLLTFGDRLWIVVLRHQWVISLFNQKVFKFFVKIFLTFYFFHFLRKSVEEGCPTVQYILLWFFELSGRDVIIFALPSPVLWNLPHKYPFIAFKEIFNCF